VPAPVYPSSLDEKLAQLQGYLPRHLADKILANRGRLQGERKLVTVLFTDVTGYTALSEQLGEEALFALMDDLYELFIHEVHRYEGTVNELTGDGIVAFFGAPLAVEQAPQRAVRAALALQEAVAQYSARLERARGLRLQVRVGINTGPVVVGTVGNNLRMDYKAVGNTVNLAARMEQTAAPGTVQITAQTHRLVAGYFDCEDLGLVGVKGISSKVRTYRVTGERRAQARIDVARERGFTRLVGREQELHLLCEGFTRAREGYGQAISIIGDAGLGKSRLLYEFRQSLVDEEFTLLEGRCSPYGTAVAYLPIIELLKQNFQIVLNDTDTDIQAKVLRGTEALGADVAAIAPYLFRLLAVEAESSIPVALAPEMVKRKTFEALQMLMLQGAARRPLILTIEDLHWVDKTTEECLTFLLEHIAGARVLLVYTHRPEFVSTWSRKSYHSVITLTRLAPQESRQMLSAMLGQVEERLTALIVEKSEGVPFFLEELVQSLQETGAIERHDGRWRLKSEATALPIPDSVEEVLMARIDRLPDEARSVLQVGAVMGREFRWELLKATTGLADHELLVHLDALTDAELLYARGVPPQTTYLFKHAFTQEAAYRSLLMPRRCDLHRRVALALETLFADRLEEYYGQLAHHFLEAAESVEIDKAIDYARCAGARAMTLAAYEEAVRFYQMALQALACQAPEDEAQRCTLLLALGEAQRTAGLSQQVLDTLQETADIARRLGLSEHLARAALEFELTTWAARYPTAPTVRLLEEALRMLGEAETALRARTLGGLARALLYTGLLQHAAAYAEQAVALARRVRDPAALAFNLAVMLDMPWGPEQTEARLIDAREVLRHAEAAGDAELITHAHSRILLCHLELGDIQAADVAIAAHSCIAEETRRPFYRYINAGFQTMRALLDGRFAEAERLAQQTLESGQQAQVAPDGVFGIQMFLLRREQGRLAELAPAVRYFVRQHTATTWRPGLALIYSELGLVQEARVEFEHLAQHDFTDLPRDGLWVTCITYLAEVCTFLQDTARAATLYHLLHPYAGRNVIVGGAVVCYGAASRYLGTLATTMARWDEAEQHFQEALAMNIRTGARPWVAHTQHDYAAMLLDRSEPEDQIQAMTLLAESLATARELGMRALETRLAARMSPLTPPLPATTLPHQWVAPDGLSQREVEVLRLVAAGKSNREIADALCISLNTVATHVRNILTKTGTANRTEAAAYALRQGLRAE
jgi:class 3 adenylate cyclase/DNA-binding NarL/FixJ family response regulator